MQGIVSLIVLYVVAVLEISGSDVCMDNAPAGAVDGCSVPLLHFDYEAQFTPSCNKHDVCYDCGHRFGFDRAACDKLFLNHMMATCTGKKRLINCQHSAEIFYSAVRVGAYFHYHETAPAYCTESWISQCLQ
ncbi:conodipine-P3-like [Saccostrea cucullata]|uniref:conodipine-P3-like n=1 Tax=Saccostrea cuccullata TaxID=36930 RepID=UPI002ED4FE09